DARFDELQCDKARPRELQVRVEQARTTFECQAGLSRRSPTGQGGSQTILSKSGTTEYSANGSLTNPTARRVSRAFEKDIYGQASRLISIGKLNASPRLHTRPITWSSSRSLQEPYGSGDLILWRVSRLDAFSVSPFRT